MDRNQALMALIEEAHRGDFHFPTSAKLAIKIRQTLEDPDCHLDAAGKLIQAEPLLAAQVISIANSVIYNPSGREITDVRSAVSRLGFATLRTMAMAFVTRQMAGASTSPAKQKLASELWEHTAHVAAISQVIATKITKLSADTALFAGLVHEIGGFYLLARSDDYPALLAVPSNGSSDINIASVENTLSLAVLRNLGIPEAVLNAVEQFAEGELSAPPKSLGDTLLLAEYMAPVHSPLSPAEPSERTIALDITVAQSTLMDILKESADEVDSLTKALRG